MKFKTRLMMFTAAAALSAGMAFAAINGQSLADSYLAEGYDFVEVKQGPTQTKVEAIKDTTKVEVIYDNATGDIIKQETEAADADDIGRSGTEVRNVDSDFEDTDGVDDDDEDHDKGKGKGDDDDDDGEDHNKGHGNDDDHDDDDNPGKGGGGHGSDHDDDDDDDGDDDGDDSSGS